MTSDHLAVLTLRLVLLRVVLNGLEVLLGRRADYQESGIFSWIVTKADRSWTSSGKIAGLLDPGMEYPNYLWLVGLQFACALLILPVHGNIQWVLLLIVLAIEFLTTLRYCIYGTDGSDGMHLIVLCAIVLYFSFSTPTARLIVLWFIALTAMVAYFAAGVGKLLNPAWRNGTAIEIVMMSENRGNRTLARWISRIPHLNQLICWSTIAFECCFPFVVFLGPTATLILLSCGIVFHFSIAASMGLNGFFWSFIATYPAVFRLALDLHSLSH